jgi:hypothetical protein
MSYTHVNLLGPYNTGTNLVNNLLKTQLKSKDDGSTRIWKHSLKKIMIENYTKEYSDTLFVICYRPMYSWIKSIEAVPNHMQIQWDGALNTPIKINDYTFNSIIDLYDTYYNNYQYLLQRCPNVIMVEYYKICDPAISYYYLKSKVAPFNVKLPSRSEYNAILNKQAKTHGPSVNNCQEAIEKQKKLSEQQPADLRINKDIIKFFEED